MVALFVALSGESAVAAVLDTQTFTEEPFSTPPSGITSMAWAPDASERLFLTVKDGPVRIIKDGELLEEPFAVHSPVETNSECGVLGIAFDPAFSENQYVYFFVTVSTSTQQIIRFTANGDVGVDRTVIIDDLPTGGQNHDGGALGFGPDGKLYWAIGDLGNGTGVDSDLSSLAAKIGRANPDGSAAPGNPFADGDGPNDDRIWARGFRNPFTLAFQPATEALWVNTVGTSYEQVFRPSAGDHAGYNDYENDQPAGFLAPVIAYRTNGSEDRTITSAARSGGVATFTTTQPVGFRVGYRVTIEEMPDASFDGAGYVIAAAGSEFSIAQTGADATVTGGGTATGEPIGGCITGGTFWDSSAPPAAYRGNFFFGDYNSARIERVTLGSNNAIATVEHFATSIGQVVDTDIGPDGNLYYATVGTDLYRTSYNASEQGLVVSRLHRRAREGSSAFVHVRLALMPAENIDVSIARSSGDSRIAVAAGAALTFTPANWAEPQPVEIRLGLDPDTADDSATFTVSSAGLPSVSVIVRSTDAGSVEEPGSAGAGGEGGVPSSGGSPPVAGEGGESGQGGAEGGSAGDSVEAGEGGAAGEPGSGGSRSPSAGASGRGGRGGAGSGAAGQAGSSAVPSSNPDDGGCGCRTPSRRSREAAFPLLLSLLGFAGVRRRARARDSRYARGPGDGKKKDRTRR
jgi:glucose/arabinose dehydrogenase